MEYRNLFDDPEGFFLILQNPQGQYSLWPQDLPLPAGWQVIVDVGSLSACDDWLMARARDLQPASFSLLSRQPDEGVL